jgi:hypothetical protein
MGINPAALFDELIKIAEERDDHPGEQPRNPSGTSQAFRAMGTAALGGAAGYGVAELLARKLPFFAAPHQGRAATAKVLLPILSGASVMLADRYRKKMDEQYSKVKGYSG